MNKTIKNKIKNCKINFSKNIITSILVPAFAVVLALVLGIIVGFNQGMDFKGGIYVSVLSENKNLEIAEEYNEFKASVDTVLQANGVSGSVYIVETEAVTYSNVLIVKINYTGEDAQSKVDGIEAGLQNKFFAELTEQEIDNRNLLSVSTFGPNVSGLDILSTILASLVATLAICIYIFARSGLFSAVLSFLSALASTVLAWALILIARVPVNKETLAVVSVVSVISTLVSFIFTRKAKALLSSTSEYERKSNYVLANDTIKSLLYPTLLISIASLGILVVFGALNILGPVLYFALALICGLLAIVYTNLFIIPAIFGLTFVRKVKRQKEIKKETESNKLSEQEVMTETDLDNLVSN